MARTVKVGKTRELAPGACKVAQVDGLSIALFNVEGTIYALDNVCTHRGGPLGEGELKGDTIECPWHGAHFNVKAGAATKPPAQTGVRSFPVQIQGDEIFVLVE